MFAGNVPCATVFDLKLVEQSIANIEKMVLSNGNFSEHTNAKPSSGCHLECTGSSALDQITQFNRPSELLWLKNLVELK